MKKILCLAAVFLSGSVLAQSSDTLDLSRYRKTVDFRVQGITTPKVVRYKSLKPLGGQVLLVEETTDQVYTEENIVPFRVVKSYEKIRNIPSSTVSSVSSTFEGSPRLMIDNNNDTYHTFDSNEKEHFVEISFAETTDISSIQILHDEGIIPPTYVSVDGLFSNNEWKPILSRRPYSWNISWPKVWVNKVKFTFETPHFFRINELKFLGQEASQSYDELVFYAQEGKSYRAFLNPSFGQKSYSGKYLPLDVDGLTPEFDLKVPEDYDEFNADFDGDGVIDLNDLCPKIKDVTNADNDNNGKGDVCDDPDQDRVITSKDNCPFEYNPGQQDEDADGKGDACDGTADQVVDNVDYLLYLVFGGVVLILGLLMWRSMKKDNNSSV